MNDSALSDLLSRDLSDAEMDRALLDLTLEAAPPAVADAIRVCALPAWFDAAHLALLTGKELEEAEELLKKVAEFSFVLPREDGGYVYHEATRARLLDGWQNPEHAERFTKLSQRLIRHYLNLARRQRPRLSGPDYLNALATMDAAYPNIVAAWERASELGAAQWVRGFAYALHDYFDRRGLWKTKIDWTQRALDACAREGNAESCAGLQNNLGNAYQDLPTGDRGANLQRAIQCYQQALTVYTPEAAPRDYAMTQNNLGTAYQDLPTGDRGANLQRAIQCYQQALRFRTPEAAPLQYATTQNNLGTAYQELPTGDRGANLQRAIQCYQQALRFRTPEAAPLDYAGTQNNLGLAYAKLTTGDRGENLRRALQCAERALNTTDLAAWERAECLFTRGLIHLAMGNEEHALADYREALSLADAVTITDAQGELGSFAADYPDTPGLDAVRALFLSQSNDRICT